MSGAEGPLYQVARLLGVVASLGETTSMAAGQAVNVTGALASAATDVIASATSNGLNTAQNVWRGVDIGQLHAHRCAGILTVDGPEALQQWLNTSAATVVIPCLTSSLEDQLLAAASSITLALPSLQTAVEHLDLLQSFNTTKVWAQLLDNGRIQAHYEVITLTFAVCWANPLWTTLDLELGSEREQILRLLRSAVIGLPAPHPASGLRSLDLEVHVSWPVILSKMKKLSRFFLLSISLAIDDTLRGWGTVSFFWWLLPSLSSAMVLTWLCFRHCAGHAFSGQTVCLALADLADEHEELSPILSSHQSVIAFPNESSASSFPFPAAAEKGERTSASDGPPEMGCPFENATVDH